MKLNSLLLSAVIGLQTQVMASGNTTFPTRELGGVSVIDTPIVRDALVLARKHGNDAVYKHIVRSWIYGVLLINSDDTLRGKVDMEVQAVSAILHDIGWDETPDSPFVSQDKRFEVDGAYGAREFIKNHPDGKDWDDRRIQLVWDSIALHTLPDIAWHKELDVASMSKGVQMDFVGPTRLGIANESYALVGKEFPKDDFFGGVKDALIWQCQHKPATTYDTFMQPWGEENVEGYTAKGTRVYDILFANYFP